MIRIPTAALAAALALALSTAAHAGEDRQLPSDPPRRPAADNPAPAREKEAEKPLLVVYPFAGKPDESGELAASVRQCIRGHALRGKAVSACDPLTEDEALARDTFRPDPATALSDVAGHARESFKAAYAVWGEIRKKDKATDKGEGYVLHVLGARIGEQDAELVADETYDCPNVHFIPQHAETFLAKLLGTPRRGLERKWPKVIKEFDELCPNGGFEKGQERPESWTVVRDDCAAQVSRKDRPGGAAGDRCLAYDMKSATADSSGIAVLSDKIPVEDGAFYRVGVDIRSKGPAVILFIKGYADVNGEPREVYNHQARYYPEKKGEWERRTTEAFHPRHPWLKVQYLRVMLYAYHPAGEVFFDNVSAKKVAVEPVEEPKLPYKKEGGGAEE